VDGTGSGLYLVVGFGASGVEPSGSAIRELGIHDIHRIYFYATKLQLYSNITA
jgi:hypothetical protein